MEVITKLDRVFESTDVCHGCGSVLGLKFVLQSLENMKNAVLVMSPGEILPMIRSRMAVNVITSRNPAATASGLARARPDMNIIAYAGDGFTNLTISSLLSASENFLYVCCNNSFLPDNSIKEFTPFVRNAAYSAAASVAYYEDFIVKLRKSFSISGFKFIDLLAPCPSKWSFDASNTIEIGRLCTETCVWPLYEIDNGISVTKIPSRIEPVKRLLEAVNVTAKEDALQLLQDRAGKRWKALNEGKLI